MSLTIAIAGASGFVGSALVTDLGRDHHIVGLSRSERQSDDVEWRQCDLYSRLQVQQALEGCDVAVYLVHSMLPSARLTQARFEDLDLILADNFAKAARQAGVQQIVYLGGLVPSDDPSALSPHLASRLEVEHALGAAGVPVTALRAGLVVGAGGSSLHILTKLVGRLPAMITPKWTDSPTQPIALRDVVRAVRRSIEQPEAHRGAFDIGGPDVMSYREMMQRTANVLSVDRPMLRAPFVSPRLSTLWVSLVTGMPIALVGPLVRSLEHAMTVEDNPLQQWLLQDAMTFDMALREALQHEARPKPRLAQRRRDRKKQRPERTVRSVQRLPRPEGHDAASVARAYIEWLPRVWPPGGLRCDVEGDDVTFRLFGLPLLVLELSPSRSVDGRALFYIIGGVLADVSGPTRGRLEFREAPNGRDMLAAIHEFRPMLPWYLYNATQAQAHAMVMWGFARHLWRMPRRRPSTAPGGAPKWAESR